jgi:hypothetical protein
VEPQLRFTDNDMSEENMLRYRLEVVQLMPEGAYKNALIVAINASFAALRSRSSLRIHCESTARPVAS